MVIFSGKKIPPYPWVGKSRFSNLRVEGRWLPPGNICFTPTPNGGLPIHVGIYEKESPYLLSSL